ncbi:unnamed protein product [Vitrella brassicaformis CCMP3155]|uniref:Uncharacterized protein n=1 Tax=Vitrella brassicaformis (strain CCMP3155) TaxID=1169540 RepID=A0A0G4E8J2_VITBC|nr:unnamed protein product [Vitrella brassicaformis CCMP3155]|eukprot:CEL91658.1 unnamed protein product [Vitrella brassicaformis CCMP3155]
MVGSHVHFSDGSCLQLFQHGNEVWAIKDEPGFRLEVDPPLPADHLYQQHRQLHDPPVRESIYYTFVHSRWLLLGGQYTDSSVSSFAKFMIVDYFDKTQQTNYTLIRLNRYVDGGRLDGLLTRSPYTPVAGCTTTMSQNGRLRRLVLTDGSHPFVAWIHISVSGNNDVSVHVVTIEAAVTGVGFFKHRYPMTTQLARVALEAVALFVFDGQVQQQQLHQQQQQQQDEDSHDSDGGGDEGDDTDEGSGGDDAAAEEESGD